jgi:hypothetical protein
MEKKKKENRSRGDSQTENQKGPKTRWQPVKMEGYFVVEGVSYDQN